MFAQKRTMVYGMLLLLFSLVAGNGVQAGSTSTSYTFWYGERPPVDLLSQFTRIVVEADNLTATDIQKLGQHGGKVLAYRSVGEKSRQREMSGAIDRPGSSARNTDWGSQVMDLAAQDGESC